MPASSRRSVLIDMPRPNRSRAFTPEDMTRSVDLAAADVSRVQRVVAPEVTGRRVGMVQVYRVVRPAGLPPDVVSVIDVASPAMPQSRSQAPVDPRAVMVNVPGTVRSAAKSGRASRTSWSVDTSMR